MYVGVETLDLRPLPPVERQYEQQYRIPFWLISKIL